MQEYPSGRHWKLVKFKEHAHAAIAANLLKKENFSPLPLANGFLLMPKTEYKKAIKCMNDNSDYWTDFTESDIEMGNIKVAEKQQVPGWNYDRWENETRVPGIENDQVFISDSSSTEQLEEHPGHLSVFSEQIMKRFMEII